MNKVLLGLLLSVTFTYTYADEEAQASCIEQFTKQCQMKCQGDDCVQKCQDDAVNQCREAGE